MLRVTIRFAVALLAVLRVAGAQEAPRPLPMFASTVPLELTIEGPFRQLTRDSSARRAERAGVLRYREADGREVSLDVDLRIRGNSRLEICSFPPLRLDFRRRQLEGTVFAGQNRLKLVTLCRRDDDYRDYLAQELQVYRMYNALTEHSFRVRRATVEYIWTDGRREERFTEPAFLIEEDWEVAGRNGLEVIEVDRLRLSELDPRPAALLGLFQFMIGNTDWSGVRGPDGESCCHNGNAIGVPGTRAIVVPYDFDQSGLISTKYARPSEVLRIRSVRERLYRGYCPMNAEIPWAVARANGARDELEAILGAEGVSASAQARALAYLRESYAIINDPVRLETEIIGRCRG